MDNIEIITPAEWIQYINDGNWWNSKVVYPTKIALIFSCMFGVKLKAIDCGYPIMGG